MYSDGDVDNMHVWEVYRQIDKGKWMKWGLLHWHSHEKRWGSLIPAYVTVLSCARISFIFALKKARVPDRNIGKTNVFHTLELEKPTFSQSNWTEQRPAIEESWSMYSMGQAYEEHVNRELHTCRQWRELKQTRQQSFLTHFTGSQANLTEMRSQQISNFYVYHSVIYVRMCTLLLTTVCYWHKV